MDDQSLEQLMDLLPLFIPILLIEIGLLVAAIVDLIRQPNTRGPKWMWVLIIIFINIIGPIVYFIVGREDI